MDPYRMNCRNSSGNCRNRTCGNMTGNREYKSDVFSMLLENPENALSLYNAMNDSDYQMQSNNLKLNLYVLYIILIMVKTGNY